MFTLVRRALVVIGAPVVAIGVSQAIYVLGRGEPQCVAELPDGAFLCAPAMHAFTGILIFGGLHSLVLLPGLWISRYSPVWRQRLAVVGGLGFVALSVWLIGRRVSPVGWRHAMGEMFEIAAPIMALVAVAIGLTRPAAPRPDPLRRTERYS